jgi:hypothetical protein
MHSHSSLDSLTPRNPKLDIVTVPPTILPRSVLSMDPASIVSRIRTANTLALALRTQDIQVTYNSR